eukprot:TRINITY_DN43223_c0_g1_i1.p1 TRINITY_DN43223_c0_g1~~TRINITY_DN43223_c0_g1_i1.p1  ORF type:complete len:233 (+),score=77.05 TRINITY_DN43223_c0_g1_i1:47-700(+)
MGAEMTDGGLASAKARAQQLMKQRAELEQELEEHVSELLATPAGLDGPLVDGEGFPRSDCDLWSVRTHRNRVACLKTDLKQCMKDLEEALHQVHSVAREEGVADAGQARPKEADPDEALRAQYKTSDPFLLVKSVTAQSPAELSELRVGDKVLSWDGVTASSAQPLPLVAEATRANEDGQIKVVVRRASGLVSVVNVRPRKWAGPGLLGCHLVPIQQ